MSAFLTIMVLFALPSAESVFDGFDLVHSAASAAQSQNPTIRVEVNLKSVDVQVKDVRGNDVLGLSPSDFTLFENGKPQKIVFFDAGNGPVSVVVLVDSSITMDSEEHLGSAQAIAAQFMRTVRPEDEVFAMDFTDQMGPFQRVTSEHLSAPSGVTFALAPGTGSALYDAIATALCHLGASTNPRQAVIVISDGVDEHSRITLEQLTQLVQSSRAQLFMIGLRSKPDFNFKGHKEPRLTLVSGRDIDNPVVVFDRLMKESGAELFIPNSEQRLARALKAVAAMLQSEYTLAYNPHGSSARVRKIEVKVHRRGAHIFARRLIGSDQDAAESVHFDEATCTVSPKFHPYSYESKLRRSPDGLIYRENFSDPLSGWPVHKDSHYISGAYELSNHSEQGSSTNEAIRSSTTDASNLTTANSPLNMSTSATYRRDVVAAYGPWWSNFRASVSVVADLRTNSSQVSASSLNSARPAAGLVFRLNLGGYYALLVSGDMNTKELSVELVRREFLDISDTRYKETQIVPWVAIGQASSSPTELTVQATGNRISILVDGQEVKTALDDAFRQGYVGFIVSGPVDAIFRNLVVKQK